MERKSCFGFIQEITRPDGLTAIETRPECRNCSEMGECLRHAQKRAETERERDEVRKQERIARILDLSQIVSNEVGSCLLQFLNRVYHSSLGGLLLQNPLLFFEVTEKNPSFSLTLPLSSSILQPIPDAEATQETGVAPAGFRCGASSRKGFMLRLIFIQTHFPGNQRATMGLIAREVIRTLISDRDGMDQILRILPVSEARRLRTMLPEAQVKWLMQRWGFEEEGKSLERVLDV